MKKFIVDRSVKYFNRLKCLFTKHKISLRAGNPWRPVVAYQFYCRRCGKVLDVCYVLEATPPALRKDQLIFTVSKYVGAEKAREWAKKQPFDEFYRNDFGETLQRVIPKPKIKG